MSSNKQVTIQYPSSYTTTCAVFKNIGSTSTKTPQDRGISFSDITISSATTWQGANYTSSWISIGY